MPSTHRPREFSITPAGLPGEEEWFKGLFDLAIRTGDVNWTTLTLSNDDMRNLVFTILGHLPEKYRAEVESWVKS